MYRKRLKIRKRDKEQEKYIGRKVILVLERDRERNTERKRER